MASIVLGAAGAFVGSFFGPLGSSIGWMLGSAIGSALTPQHQDGPRLSDLKLQVSEYGRMIPLPYGVGRIAGNVVWQTDLVEHKHTEGGKGGGPSVTTYTYTASFAVQLCAGPLVTTLRMWADGRLIYDPNSSVGQSLNFTFYPGNETQGPDPTIELDLGVGNVVGYRGTAVLVFPDLPLTDFGNRIPNIEVEVVTSTSGTVPWRYALFERPKSLPNNSIGIEGNTGGYLQAMIGNCLPSYGQWYTVKQYDLHNNEGDTVTDVLAPMVDPTSTGSDSVYCVANSARYAWGTQSSSYDSSEPSQSAWYLDGVKVTAPIAQALGTGTLFSVSADPAAVTWSAQNAALYGIGQSATGGAPSGLFYVAKYPITSDIPSGSPAFYYDTWGVGSVPTTISAGNDGFVYVVTEDDIGGGAFATSLWKFDADLTLVHKWDNDAVETNPAHRLKERVSIGFCVTNDHKILYGSRAGNVVLEQINGDNTITLLGEIAAQTFDTGLPMALITNSLASVGHGVVSIAPPPGAISLASIVSDLSVRAGLDPSEIDVTQLTDLVHFYVVSQQMTGRTGIEPLQQAFFFDAVESSGQAKFVKRGQAPVITIPDNDLGTRAKGEQVPPLITYTRAQEEDLPRSITVKYKNIEADYQPGTQSEPRQVTLSKLDTTIEFPLAMYDLEAKQKAAGLLYNAWLERDRFVINTPRKYDHLEPTDVVVAHGYDMRLSHRNDVQKGVLSFEALGAGAYVWLQGSVAGSGPGSTQTVTPPQTTTLQLLDIPLVDDSDTPGFYAAAAGASATAWPGETLYKSTDGGTTYSSVDSETVPSVIGTSSTVLGDFAGGNVFDKLSRVTVVLGAGAGALSSASESAVLNGANMALLGNEIIAFQTATLTAPLTYELADMLRGRRGTEWAMPGHVAAERFVLLPVPAITLTTSEIGLPRKYKAITSGALLSSAVPQSFTVAGVAWQPYAPVHLGGGIDAAGDVTLNWTRRTRIGGAWRGPSNTPLGETSEAYVVQIWDATYTQCARIITGLTNPTATYSSADQVTDFGAQQQHIYFTVGQVGTYALGTQAHGVAAGAGGSDVAPLAPITPYGNPPPVVSSGCTLPVPVTTVMSSGTRYTNPDWHDGEIWLLQFTTGLSGSEGRISMAEDGGGPVTRFAVLSDTPCGAPIGPGASKEDVTITMPWWVGAGNPNPLMYPTLAASTTYFISCRTDAPSPAFVDFAQT